MLVSNILCAKGNGKPDQDCLDGYRSNQYFAAIDKEFFAPVESIVATSGKITMGRVAVESETLPIVVYRVITPVRMRFSVCDRP